MPTGLFDGKFRRQTQEPDVVAKSSGQGAGGLTQKPAPTVGHVRPIAPINNALWWLVNALGIKSQNIPKALSTEPVTPIIDASGFAGWGLAQYQQFDIGTLPGGGSSNSMNWLAPPHLTDTQVLVGLTLQNVTANPLTIWLGLLSLDSPITAGAGAVAGAVSDQAAPGALIYNSNASPLVLVNGLTMIAGPVQMPVTTGTTIAAENSIALAQILGGARFIVAPPRFGIIIICGPGGGTCRAFGTTAAIPGAFGAGR